MHCRPHRFLLHLVHVEQIVALLRDQDVVGLPDQELARLGALAHRLTQYVLEVDHPHLPARDVEGGKLWA